MKLRSLMALEAIGRVLAKFGELYWSPEGFCVPETFHRLSRGGWKEALAFFLHRYAFERAGRSPQYPKAAREAVREYPGEAPGDDREDFVWETFRRKIGGHKPNPKTNPLAPTEGTSVSITAFIQMKVALLPPLERTSALIVKPNVSRKKGRSASVSRTNHQKWSTR